MGVRALCEPWHGAVGGAHCAAPLVLAVHPLARRRTGTRQGLTQCTHSHCILCTLLTEARALCVPHRNEPGDIYSDQRKSATPQFITADMRPAGFSPEKHKDH